MFEASTTGNLEQVQQLLAKGVNIEALDHNGKYILKLEVECFLNNFLSMKSYFLNVLLHLQNIHMMILFYKTEISRKDQSLGGC